MAVKRLTTRGYATAEAIKHLEPFKTSGSFHATNDNEGSGMLNGEDFSKFAADMTEAYAKALHKYIVYSYATPIAWYVEGKGWYKVARKFSVTTTKHQGNLYLV